MDKKEQLNAMIDGIINNDEEAAKAAFSPYIQSKTRDILGYQQPSTEVVDEPIQESAQVIALREMLDAQADFPVRLNGDDVVVDGKVVGAVRTDMTDFDAGIEFIEAGGNFSKEFISVEDLYKFLVDKYTKHGKNT